jgi:transcriptional regulator with XRE-family HTH domain
VKNPLGVKAFGTHLRILRESRDLSQQELADLSDIAKTTIQRIENAKLCATVDVLISISRALNVPLSELTDLILPKEKPKK